MAIHRRALAVLAMSFGSTALAGVTADPELLALSRRVVTLRRGEFPDLTRLVAGTASAGDVAFRDIVAVVRREAEVEEPVFREGLARILASYLTTAELEAALAGRSIRAIVAANAEADRLAARLNEFIFRSAAVVGERADRRAGVAQGEP